MPKIIIPIALKVFSSMEIKYVDTVLLINETWYIYIRGLIRISPDILVIKRRTQALPTSPLFRGRKWMMRQEIRAPQFIAACLGRKVYGEEQVSGDPPMATGMSRCPTSKMRGCVERLYHHKIPSLYLVTIVVRRCSREG